MMVRWEMTALRLVFVLTMAVQILTGAGFAVGIGLFIDLPPEAALYFTTGVATMTLMIVGMVLGPQLVAQQKAEDTYDFLWSLPVPRFVAAAAWFTITVFFALPGMIAALVVAGWRFDLTFEISFAVVPAVFLTTFAATLIGYAMAHSIPDPQVTGAITQVLIFAIMGFSPINFPPDRLPGWLASIHEWLPFQAMADVMRDALTTGFVSDPSRAYRVVLLWSAAAVALTAWVLGRRK
jgi:ABC-2 type transport system permease protein